MTVSRTDVRRIATLARLGVPDDRLNSLVVELNGILAHMDVLQRVDTDGVPADGDDRSPMPLRPDEGPPEPLAHARERIAPAMRDGFFLVPRLATHGDAEDSA